jgi:hypothetical protein
LTRKVFVADNVTVVDDVYQGPDLSGSPQSLHLLTAADMSAARRLTDR